MKPLSQKPPLSQKKPLGGLVNIFSPSKQKDVTFRHIPRNPQIFNDDNAFNKKLDIRDICNNFDFASYIPVKPKSQPHSGPENPFVEGNIKAGSKNCFRDSTKRTNTIIGSPSKTLKTEENEQPEKHRKLNNIFTDNAQQSLGYKRRDNSPLNVNIREMEYRIPPSREKSPYARPQMVNGSTVRQKVLPKKEMSPVKSRPELSSLPKDDSWSKKELKQSNMVANIQKSKITLPRVSTVANYANKNTSPRQLHFVEPKKSALVVLDHDLGFIKDHMSGFVMPWNVSFEKLENIGAVLENEGDDKRYGLTGYHVLFVFIKFSPRVKRQSLKVLQALARSERCFVVKCVLDVESVDLHLDYENSAMTMERKKYIEHILYLERESFDSFSISHEALISLETFLNGKIRGHPILSK